MVMNVVPVLMCCDDVREFEVRSCRTRSRHGLRHSLPQLRVAGWLKDNKFVISGLSYLKFFCLVSFFKKKKDCLTPARNNYFFFLLPFLSFFSFLGHLVSTFFLFFFISFSWHFMIGKEKWPTFNAIKE